MDSLYTFPLDFDLNINQTNYYWFQEGFTPEELNYIEEQVGNLPFQKGLTEADDPENDQTSEARSSMIKWVPFNNDTKWIYDKIGELATIANNEIYHFDLNTMPEMIQYTEYYGSNMGHYDWHMDIGTQGYMKYRKISVTVQLSGPDEYEGGDLQIWAGGQYPWNAPRGKGNVVIFPSFMMHRVLPVTKGTRKSFVLWLGGGHYR